MQPDSRILTSLLDIEVYIFSTLAQIDTCLQKTHLTLIVGPMPF